MPGRPGGPAPPRRAAVPYLKGARLEAHRSSQQPHQHVWIWQLAPGGGRGVWAPTGLRWRVCSAGAGTLGRSPHPAAPGLCSIKMDSRCPACRPTARGQGSARASQAPGDREQPPKSPPPCERRFARRSHAVPPPRPRKGRPHTSASRNRRRLRHRTRFSPNLPALTNNAKHREPSGNG